MKTYILLCTCLLLRGSCVGPDISSNFELNNADGQYIMTALIDIVEGKKKSIDVAPERRQVNVKRIPSDRKDSKFPYSGYFYRFNFSSLNGKNTSSLDAFYTSVEYDDKYHQERQWLTINDSTGLLVVLERDIGRGVTTRLMISNVMKSAAYKSELDTIRYVYSPKFN